MKPKIGRLILLHCATGAISAEPILINQTGQNTCVHIKVCRRGTIEHSTNSMNGEQLKTEKQRIIEENQDLTAAFNVLGIDVYSMEDAQNE